MDFKYYIKICNLPPHTPDYIKKHLKIDTITGMVKIYLIYMIYFMKSKKSVDGFLPPQTETININKVENPHQILF